MVFLTHVHILKELQFVLSAFIAKFLCSSRYSDTVPFVSIAAMHIYIYITNLWHSNDTLIQLNTKVYIQKHTSELLCTPVFFFSGVP